MAWDSILLRMLMNMSGDGSNKLWKLLEAGSITSYMNFLCLPQDKVVSQTTPALHTIFTNRQDVKTLIAHSYGISVLYPHFSADYGRL
jgi:hypothetical protein